MNSLQIPVVEFGALVADVLQRSHRVRFRVRGRSMYPSIRNGDIVLVEKTDPASLRVGDVVVVRNGAGTLLVHRIVRIVRCDGRRGCITRGDAGFHEDGDMRAEQVLGRVRSVERDGRAFRVDKGLRRVAGVLRARLYSARRLTRYVRSAIKRLRKSTV